VDVPLIRRAESHFAAAGARSLFRRAWLPEEPRCLVVVAHGYAEHSGRYEAVGSWLAAEGCAVHALDLVGHGLSEGPRGHVGAFDDFLGDLDAFLALCRAEHNGLPVFVLGHSMGGLIVAAWAQRSRPDVAGLILSGPALVAGEVPARWQIALLQLLRRVLPRLRMPRPIAPEALSRDPEVGRAYVADPLIFQHMTLSLAGSLFEAGGRTLGSAAKIEVPTLLLHGEDDPLVLASGSRQFFEQLGTSGSDLRIYPGLRHEIFNEPEGEKVLGDVMAWIRKQEVS
jgi:alpha-beta hydrolase superfamily lysophospholipase